MEEITQSVEQLELPIDHTIDLPTKKEPKVRKPRQGKRIPKTTVNPLVKDMHLIKTAVQIIQDKETKELMVTVSNDQGNDEKDFNKLSDPEKYCELVVFMLKDPELVKIVLDKYVETFQKQKEEDEITN